MRQRAIDAERNSHGLITAERWDAADRSLAHRLASIYGAQMGWSPEQIARAEEAAYDAPQAIYKGDRMYPVDICKIMREAVV